jgi:ATP-binding cassette, subfamily B, bacterial
MFKNIKKLSALLGKQKWNYLLATLLLMITIFMRTLEPKILQSVIDVIVFTKQGNPSQNTIDTDSITRLIFNVLPQISANNLTNILILLGCLFFVITLVRAFIFVFSQIIVSSATEKAIKMLRDKIYHHVQYLPVSYFTTVPKGELIQRSTGDIERVRYFFQNHIVEMVRFVCIFGFAFAMMCIVNVKFAFISISLSPVIFISGIWYFKRARKLWREHEAEADKLNARIQENLSGISTVKTYAKEKYEIRAFRAQNLRIKKRGMKMVQIETFYWPLSNFVIHLQFAVSLVAGGYFVLHEVITLGQLAATFFYFNMLSMPMRMIGRVISRLSMSIIAMNRINEVLDHPKEDYNEEGLKNPLMGKITFKDVSFKYPGENNYVLNNLSFTIFPGEKVAIIGAVGSGKSTLIKLLLRFFDDYEGSILIDDIDIRKYSKSELRKRMGVTFQMPFLFSTRIDDNMAYSKPGTGFEKIKTAAHMACIEELYDILPQGLETRVGEKGVTLSGGQKQRVSIARTILSEPDVFIFDDITSAIDAHTENLIYKRLYGQIINKTTLIISHRITSLKWADKIIVLENGSLIQSGLLKDLKNKPGYLKYIFDLQSGNVACEEEMSPELRNI